MFKEILEKIKEYEKIVIARHVGVDPDAMASQVALRDIILLNFPDKKVTAVGAGSSKFTYIGSLDKQDEDIKDTLLIVLDTPDKGRVDINNIDSYKEIIKIDHHPFMETFGEIEHVNTDVSSASELVGYFAYDMKLEMNSSIARNIYIGMVSDTNRFMFNNSKPSSFKLASMLIEDFDLDVSSIYSDLYLRPMSEVRLEGYIAQNMFVTDNKFGYMLLTKDMIDNFGADIASAGNLINNFNFIDELLVWTTITEDTKNDMLKVNIRSRGPIINDIAENYNGGGHQFASGARLYEYSDYNKLIKDLDERCKSFIEDMEE